MDFAQIIVAILKCFSYDLKAALIKFLKKWVKSTVKKTKTRKKKHNRTERSIKPRTGASGKRKVTRKRNKGENKTRIVIIACCGRMSVLILSGTNDGQLVINCE